MVQQDDCSQLFNVLDNTVIRITLDRDGTIVEVNHLFENLIGMIQSDMQGQNLYSLLRKAQGDFFVESILESLTERDAWRGEINIISRSGYSFWIEGELLPFQSGDKDQPIFVFVGFNVSDRKLVERELAAKEQLTRTIMRHAPVGIFQLNEQGMYNFVNQRWSEITALTSPPQGTLDWTVIVWSKERAAVSALWEKCRVSHTSYHGTFRLVSNDEREHWAECRICPLCNEAGGVTDFLGILEDVSERQQVEQERARLQRQLMEASHQAGMAEVATGVLHNVGNVLNSVNVSAEMIASKLRESKVEGVGKVCELLERERLNLPQFFSQPEKSEQLVTYVRRVSEQLQNERTDIQAELTGLVKSINHIKETVARQQEQAKLSGVQMNIVLSELMEEALAIHEGSLSLWHIEIVREYSDSEPRLLEKHKVLQILVNLISNAKHAMQGVSDRTAQLTLRTGYDSAGLLFAEVEDNGIGIPEQNLTKIFFYGFTTKKDGHGFGLHSSALAAKQIGASLIATSVGAGRGACFRLTLDENAQKTQNNLIHQGIQN